MAEENEGRQIGINSENNSGGSTVHLDLSGPAGYTRSVEWVRDNVVLKDAGDSESVMQLDVALPENAEVTLFMDPRDHYILGFRGQDRAYLLEDDHTAKFRKRLVQSKLVENDQEIFELSGLRASHAGLGTFERSDGGIRAKVFSEADLKSAAVLSGYSHRNKDKVPYDLLKTPLSILVCMISESARIPMMQRDFMNMFYGHRVVADEAVRSFNDAKFLMKLSKETFPEYPARLGVEKLQKRAAEMDGLLKDVTAAAGESNRQKVLTDLLRGTTGAGAAKSPDKVKRLREMAEELKFDAAQITQLISTCSSEAAVRAAMQGVAIPPVGNTTAAGRRR